MQLFRRSVRFLSCPGTGPSHLPMINWKITLCQQHNAYSADHHPAEPDDKVMSQLFERSPHVGIGARDIDLICAIDGGTRAGTVGRAWICPAAETCIVHGHEAAIPGWGGTGCLNESRSLMVTCVR